MSNVVKVISLVFSNIGLPTIYVTHFDDPLGVYDVSADDETVSGMGMIVRF